MHIDHPASVKRTYSEKRLLPSRRTSSVESLFNFFIPLWLSSSPIISISSVLTMITGRRRRPVRWRRWSRWLGWGTS
ncbi:hypothetical protein BJX66DRAFT_3399 [Aspergillus keveii]|uniref:Uncharacterized protein n=1 Tax=Aspergillus keveii TaxID=714993 RepID=A0ABR4GQ25_9EURO